MMTKSSIADEPRVHNLGFTFSQFWDSVVSLPAEVQALEFKLRFAPQFRAFYDYKFEKWASDGRDIDVEITAQLKDFPQISDAFRSRSAHFESEIANHVKSFSSVFPDFNSDVEIYVTHSLGEMDGGMRNIDGKVYLIFGIDGMLKFHNASNDTPFFHHELFHLYHSQLFDGPDVIWTALWREGLATYVSEHLNPGASVQEILLDVPQGLVRACDQHLPELWDDLEEHLTSNSEEDYQTYFLTSSRSSWIPKRAGYYLGYLISKEMGSIRSLRELAMMEGESLYAQIRTAITNLRGPTANGDRAQK